MKLYLEIDIRPYLRMWKSKDNGTSNKKVMKTFYELFAQPSYVLSMVNENNFHFVLTGQTLQGHHHHHNQIFD